MIVKYNDYSSTSDFTKVKVISNYEDDAFGSMFQILKKTGDFPTGHTGPEYHLCTLGLPGLAWDTDKSEIERKLKYVLTSFKKQATDPNGDQVICDLTVAAPDEGGTNVL